jgi:glycosyltransferase involved in cell wall biosynthesis
MLFAMDVLAALRERRPGLRVAVLGEGPQRTEIEERISQNGLQGTVELMGHQPEGVVRLTCNQSKVFFAPSHFEGLSLAAVESLGLGLDAVVSTSTSFTKVFPNELGVRFCAPDDIQANMKALDETISNFRFRERPHLRQRFSIERYARELSETYREIARQAP